jgi:hypothetical protein
MNHERTIKTDTNKQPSTPKNLKRQQQNHYIQNWPGQAIINNDAVTAAPSQDRLISTMMQ